MHVPFRNPPGFLTVDDNAKMLELMGAGKIRSTTIPVRFEEVGDAIGMVRRGEASGRFVVIYD